MADIRGTEFSDYLPGTDENDFIEGLGGDDTIFGEAGDDRIYGGDGNDYLVAGDGNDIVYGGFGNDQIYSYGRGNDVLFGEAGSDVFEIVRYFSESTDFIQAYAGGGNDTLYVELYEANSVAAQMGGGNDYVVLANLDDSTVRLSLGGGTDTVALRDYANLGSDSLITVTDFETGDAGDRLEFYSYLVYNLSQPSDGNPFATGFLRLVQDGADSLLQIDFDGGGDDYRTKIVFENTDASSFTAYNFDGLPPDGSALPLNEITGTEFSEGLYGTDRPDLIRGLGGDDYIIGFRGSDMLYGGDGNDVIDAGSGNDTLYGGSGNDELYSYDSGDDVIYGEGGDDFIYFYRDTFLTSDRLQAYGGGGSDNLYLAITNDSRLNARMGGGDDLVSIVSLGNGQTTISLGAGSDRILFDENLQLSQDVRLTITDFETGSLGDSVSLSLYLDRTLQGWTDGNPFAQGYLALVQDGANTLLQLDEDGGGDSLRTIAVFANTEAGSFTAENFDGLPPDGSPIPPNEILGSEFSDYLYGTGRGDIIQGFGGFDQIYGLGGDDIIYGGDDDDFIDAGAGNNVVYGGTGNDSIYAFDGVRDVLFGEAGNDYFAIYRAPDTESGLIQAYGGGGRDIVELSVYNDSRVVLQMGGGNDDVYVYGRGTGEARVSLGAGQDRVFLQGSTFEFASTTLITDFETGDGGDQLNLQYLLDYGFSGLSGSDNPFGLGYAQLVQDGADTLLQLDYDGGGNEYVTVVTFLNVDAITLTTFNFDGVPPDGSDLPGITLVGGEYSDYLLGTERADTLSGLGGADQIYGLGGDDQIDGGDGDDYLVDGFGDDIVRGGDGNDTFESYEGGSDELYGGLGNDVFFIRREQATESNLVQVDAGAGNDYLYFESDSWREDSVGSTLVADLGEGDDYARLDGISSGDIRLSLGAGSDVVLLRQFGSNYDLGRLTISDFDTGDSGDQIAFDNGFNSYLRDWDGSENPFGSGYLRLAEDGSNTLFQINYDAQGDDFVTLIVFENTEVSSFTAFNFEGYDPDGSAPAGVTIEGTDFADRLTGTVGPDTIYGFGGSDRIDGSAGADFIDGGAGDDIIDDGSGDDVVYGGDGNDYFRSVDGGNDVLFGGAGDDYFSVSRGSNFNAEFIQVYAGAGNDYLYLQENGSNSRMVARMGGGNDTVEIMRIGEGGLNLSLGGGSDVIYFPYANNIESNSGPLVVTDFGSDDSFNLTDVLSQIGVYFDPFETGYLRLVQDGADTILEFSANGSSGPYSEVATLLNVDATSLAASNFQTFGEYDPVVIQAITGTSGRDILNGTTNADRLVGLGGNDQLNGGEGADVLVGGAGYDLLIGGSGSDYLDGGNGVDTASYRDSSEARNIYLYAGVAYSQSGTDTDTLVSIENIIGSMFDDYILADEGDNIISGLSGDDFIREADSFSGGVNRFYGGAGNDNLVSLYGTTYFNGGAGDDYFRGGVNVDTYIGGIGFDRISFFNEEATQGVIADLRTQTITNDGFGNAETMSSIEGLGSGTQFADELYGDDRGNLIIGGEGGDLLYGFGGNDRFQLNGAPAIVDGGDGVDYAYFTGGQLGPDTNGDGLADFVESVEGVVVDLATGEIVSDGFGASGTIVNIEELGGASFGDMLYGDDGDNRLLGFGGDDLLEGRGGNDVLDGGIGDDVLRGGAFSDRLFGGAGNDELDGGYGNDRLDGGSGTDVLTGGFGADRFVFTQEDLEVDIALADIITDFSQAQGDLIDMSAIDADLFTDADQAFTFVGDAAFSGIAGELRYESDGTRTLVEADYDGDGVADFVLLLDGDIPLETADFVL